MLKYASALLVILAAVSFASAAADVSWTEADLGGGMMAVTFYADTDDGNLASFAATLGFEGINGASIVQTLAFGVVVVNTEDNAVTYGVAATDSYALNPFANNPIPGTGPISGVTFTGFNEAANLYEMSLGTGTAEGFGTGTPLAKILVENVTTLDYLSYAGVVARAGANNPVSGVVGIPEPATMSLLAFGGIAALIRRRR